jgi:hypothetical protein
MTRMTPLRLTILHLSQIFLIEALTFTIRPSLFKNPKSEYRNPKQTQILKTKIFQPLTSFEHSKFGHFRLFRISHFVLRNSLRT